MFEKECAGSHAKWSPVHRSPNGVTPSAKQNKGGLEENAPNMHGELQAEQS